MSKFTMPVIDYMSAPVYTIDASERLPIAQQRLRTLGISSLAVVDQADALIGVLSRSDLLRIGRRKAAESGNVSLLAVPDVPVADAMTREVVTVDPDDTIAFACRRMVQRWIHRVFVVEGNTAIGILTTRNVMFAIRNQRVPVPIGEVMSRPIMVIRANESIANAAARLDITRVSGLVVTNRHWQVGVFTQVEALGCCDCSPDVPVEEVMNPAMVCMAASTPLHRAAEHALNIQTRHLIACRQGDPVGILTGVDFARATL